MVGTMNCGQTIDRKRWNAAHSYCVNMKNIGCIQRGRINNTLYLHDHQEAVIVKEILETNLGEEDHSEWTRFEWTK